MTIAEAPDRVTVKGDNKRYVDGAGLVFRVVYGCEHADETCMCICHCGGFVWHDHADELCGPINPDLPSNQGDQYGSRICPDPPILYAGS